VLANIQWIFIEMAQKYPKGDLSYFGCFSYFAIFMAQAYL